MVGEGHLGGDTGAEAAESATQNSYTETEGRASAKAQGCEEPTRQVWLTQSKKRTQATVGRGFLEAQAEVEQEAAQEPEKAEKKTKKKKGYTFTKEQVEQMELAVKQLETTKDQFTRLTAEYDNYRKRTTKEKDNIYQDAKADTIKAFLDVYDNLERAAATGGDEESPHKKGLEMIFQQYKTILEKLGVTEIEAKGQQFDPEKMNAVMHIDDESLGENEVAQVFQAGFQMGDKVIRYAIVQVAN